MRDGSLLELLYANDIAIAAEIPQDTRKHIVWKSAMESKGLSVSEPRNWETSLKSPVLLLSLLVDFVIVEDTIKLIMCTFCKTWVHGRRTGIRGSLSLHKSNFQRSTCEAPAVSDPASRNSFDE